MSDRKGGLTNEQEKLVANHLKDEGIGGVLARAAVKLVDNQVVDRLLDKLDPELREDIYEMIDAIFEEVEDSKVELAGVPDEDPGEDDAPR